MDDADFARVLQERGEAQGIRRLAVAPGLLRSAGRELTSVLPSGPWMVAADEITWSVAGHEVADAIAAAGGRTEQHLVSLRPGRDTAVAGDAEVDSLAADLQARGCRAVVAVGAGTVNDIAKLASFRAHVAFATIPTAPSMNGYTSGIAAILSNGVKTTADAHLPVACLADVDILRQAPQRLLAAGLGDLLSRPVSCADWHLSHRFLGTDCPSAALALIEESGDLARAAIDGIPERQPRAVARLAGALLISGLAMGLAATSAPASGGEHLISHYLDMTHFSQGLPHDLHGCQVGVATLATARLYQRLLTVRADSIEVDECVGAWPGWPETARQVEEAFGSLAPAVLPHARAKYPSRETLRARLGSIRDEWPGIVGELSTILRPAHAIRADLELAGCPVSFADIGVDAARAHQALLHSRHVRARYTILDLAAELGLLQDWVGEVLGDEASRSPQQAPL